MTFGVDPGYAARFSDTEVGHGAALGLLSSAGLTDTWSLRGRFSYAIEPGPRTIHLFLLGSDLLYLVDILELVPYGGAGIDGVGRLTGSRFDIDMGVHAAVGIDYLLSRSAAVGLELRPVLVITRLDDSPCYLFANTTFSFIFDM
jgi:hypothetical protein